MVRVMVYVYKPHYTFIFSCSNQVSVWIHVVLRQNLVLTVLDVKPRVWKTVDVSSVFALKVKVGTAVKMPLEIVHFMQILQIPLRVCILYTHRTTSRTASSVTLTSGPR